MTRGLPLAPRTGERKLQILQTLATMLEHPRGERVTTAALAARLDVSEAALYRHFASKAQMFEGLIEFVEQSLFGLINQISAEQTDGMRQAQSIMTVLLTFAEKNPGIVRVLIGDALIHEDERLQVRINQLLDRIESTLRQALRIAQASDRRHDGSAEAVAQTVTTAAPGAGASAAGTTAAGRGGASTSDTTAAHANLMLCHVIGRWQQYARSGFRRKPTEHWPQQWVFIA